MGRLAIANKQFFIVGLQVLSFCLQASCVFQAYGRKKPPVATSEQL